MRLVDAAALVVRSSVMIISFTKVKRPWGWLGNMSPHPVLLDDVLWRTAEHAFQASRFPDDHPLRAHILGLASPMAAKMAVKRVRRDAVHEPRSPQDLDLMRRVVRAKHDQHLSLQALLQATRPNEIVEDVSSRPNESGLFWGAANPHVVTDRRGLNWLGRIWMEIRDGAP